MPRFNINFSNNYTTNYTTQDLLLHQANVTKPPPTTVLTTVNEPKPVTSREKAYSIFNGKITHGPLNSAGIEREKNEKKLAVEKQKKTKK